MMCISFPKAGKALSCALLILPAISHAKNTSNVQLYGIIDAGMQYLSNGPGGNDMTGLSSGNLNGSRWGFKGSEDLGDGLKAVFTLESGISMTDGTTLQGGRLFGRQAYVGLSSKHLGELTLGRHNTLMIDWMSKYSPFANANFSGKRADPAFSDRMDHSIKYVGKFGGFSVGAYYSTAWNNAQDWEDKKRGRMMGAGVRYAAGALDAAVLYHSKHANAPRAGADSSNREDRILAGVSYKLDAFTVYGGYRWLKQRLTREDFRSDMYWAGVQYRPSKPTRLSLAVFRVNGTVCDNLNNAACPAVQGAGKDQKPTLLLLGGEYDLSKRTTLYALSAYAINKEGSSLSVAGGNYGANVEPGKNQFGLQIGMRHRF